MCNHKWQTVWPPVKLSSSLETFRFRDCALNQRLICASFSCNSFQSWLMSNCKHYATCLLLRKTTNWSFRSIIWIFGAVPHAVYVVWVFNRQLQYVMLIRCKSCLSALVSLPVWLNAVPASFCCVKLLIVVWWVSFGPVNPPKSCWILSVQKISSVELIFLQCNLLIISCWILFLNIQSLLALLLLYPDF